MTRTLRLLGAALAPLSLAMASSCSPKKEAEPARVDGVVLFVVDTLRTDHLSTYGYDRATSPHLDAFAEDALVFDNCRSQSTWTKPSTASILTGLYPSEHGADRETAAMPEAVVSLAERLAAAGVETGSFYTNGWLVEKHGLQQGFAVSEFFPEETPDGTRVAVDRALDFVRSCGEGPFFAYVHTVDPHSPYDPPEPYRTEFDSGAVSAVTGSMRRPDGRPIPVSRLSPEDVSHLVGLYDGEVRAADEGFGQLLSGLRDLGRYERTAIFFLADHGEELRDHGGWHHGPRMYDEVLRIPLVVRAPGLDPARQGTRVRGLAFQVDIAPTVLHLFQLETPASLPGHDLFELPAEPASPPRYAISEVDTAGVSRRAVIGNGEKYIRAWSPRAEEFLFDLRADPGETTNLLAAHPELAQTQRALLRSYLERTERGLFLLFENGGDGFLTVEVQLFHGPDEASDPDVRGLYTEEKAGKRELKDGTAEVQPGMRNGAPCRTTRVVLHVEPRDADGLHILPAAGASGGNATLELLVLMNGDPIEARFVRLGRGEGTPGAMPLTIRLPLDPALASAPFPAREDLGGEPYRLRVWCAVPDTKSVEFSQDEVEAFRALGYMGGEE